MNNRRMTHGLVAFFIVLICIAGCIPEDSLQWSEDGSAGLLRVEEALYLVDGQIGELTEIAKENVQPWPDISEDGSLIAYSEEVECDNLSQGLKLLPPGQVKMIQYNAKRMSEAILKAGGLVDGKFPDPYEELFRLEDYGNWVIRHLCENADSELLKILGDEGIEKGKEKAIRYFQVVVVSRDKLEDKHIITANIFGTVATRLSPNNQYVAYIMQTQYRQEDEEYSLYVASLKGDGKAMLVDQRVAFGYDWSKDSRTIAYIKADSENIGDGDAALGTLQERVIADVDDNLLAESIEIEKKEHGSVGTHKCTGQVTPLVGLIYYPWLKIQYGFGERIFFSSCVLPLPASKRDEPGWSLFCYDSVTGTVTDVLPQAVSNYTSQAVCMLQFDLSPDGKYVLLPIKNNRFLNYELGTTDSIEIPIEEDEGFGEEEISELTPSWKGNNEISFLVSNNSHFLSKTKEGQGKPDRYEIVILRRTNGRSRVLSKNWPDEVMSNLEDDN